MIYLRGLRLKESRPIPERFPFTLGIFHDLAIEFSAPVTFLVGENGTGKSTLIEALARATELPIVGGERIEKDATLAYTKDLSAAFRLSWTTRTRRGFFLRAEDFFRFCRGMQNLAAEMDEDAAHFEKNLKGYGLQLARGAVLGQKHEIQKRYGEALDGQSHGESFLRLFQERFSPSGLYLLDEPETPLSPLRQLTLLSMLKEMTQEHGSQFIIATHSPILMALPQAEILCFDGGKIQKARYDDLEHVTLTRRFLENPERFLKHL